MFKAFKIALGVLLAIIVFKLTLAAIIVGAAYALHEHNKTQKAPATKTQVYTNENRKR